MNDRPYRHHSYRELRELREGTEASRATTYRLFSEERQHAPGSESMQILSHSYDHLSNTLTKIDAELEARHAERQRRST